MMGNNNLDEVKVEWKLSDIYKNVEELKKDIEIELGLLQKLATFKGKLNNKKDILEFYSLDEKLSLIASKTSAYINLRLQKNMKDIEILKIDSEIEPKFKKAYKELIFVEDEILANDKELLEDILKDSEFERFNAVLRREFKAKGHTLTQEQKLLMNHIGSVMNFSNIYDIIENEIKFEKAEDKEGNLHEVTHSKYVPLMESKDRVLRKNAFDSMYNNYKNSEQSTTEIYLSEVKIETEFAKLLNYNSLLDRSTRADESTTKVYDALISSVNKNMKIYHKYHDLRKKVLGLKDYTSYDLYVNIIETADDKKYTIEEARDIILENLSILRRRIYISSKKSIF